MFSRSNSDPLISRPLNKAMGLNRRRRSFGVAAPTGPPLVRREPQFDKFRPGRSASPTNGLACISSAPQAPHFSCNPRAGFAVAIETVMLS
jgi:hypothetical protein